MLGTFSMWQIFYLRQIAGCIFLTKFFICIFIFQFSWQICILEPGMVAIVKNKNYHFTVDFGAYTIREKWKHHQFFENLK